MKKNNKDIFNKIIKDISNEDVAFSGIINFASRGIIGDAEMLFKAYSYGYEIGVECAKLDAIQIIKKRIKK